jgi:hypothetical protein
MDGGYGIDPPNDNFGCNNDHFTEMLNAFLPRAASDERKFIGKTLTLSEMAKLRNKANYRLVCHDDEYMKEKALDSVPEKPSGRRYVYIFLWLDANKKVTRITYY